MCLFFLELLDKSFRVDIIMITSINRYVKKLSWIIARPLLFMMCNLMRVQLMLTWRSRMMSAQKLHSLGRCWSNGKQWIFVLGMVNHFCASWGEIRLIFSVIHFLASSSQGLLDNTVTQLLIGLESTNLLAFYLATLIEWASRLLNRVQQLPAAKCWI